MKNEIYNVDYFINKFEAIPEEKWCTGDFNLIDINGNITYCANGLCGVYFNKQEYIVYKTGEALALAEILSQLKITCDHTYKDPIYATTAIINDGHTAEYQQPTPKQRILAALYDIKRIEQPYQVTHLYIPHIVKISESILIEVNEN